VIKIEHEYRLGKSHFMITFAFISFQSAEVRNLALVEIHYDKIFTIAFAIASSSCQITVDT
jgi:hypothetical protein